MAAKPNAYSPRWFEFFHAEIPASRTSAEVEFVCACAPLPHFRRVLDLCCGMGRHARPLSARGYSVTAVERDAAAVAKARELAGGPDYIKADVREYQPRNAAYDVAIVMSQSFGYFDAETNRTLLTRWAAGLREGGRVVLDLWNPEFFARHAGERDFESAKGTVRERKQMAGERLYVQLAYPGGGMDEFEWQLFTLSEMTMLAESAGLTLVRACTGFDAAAVPSPENPRVQYVLERRAAR